MKMTPLEQYDQMLRLQSALDSVTKVGQKRQMNYSDIQAILESLKNLSKKTEKTT